MSRNVDNLEADGTGVGAFIPAPSSFSSCSSRELPTREMYYFCYKTGQSAMSSPPMIPGSLHGPQPGGHDSGLDGDSAVSKGFTNSQLKSLLTAEGGLPRTEPHPALLRVVSSITSQ